MPKIGAHVSAAVSLETAFEKALNIGAECFQFFIAPPQQWLQTKHDDAEVKRFLAKASETQIGPYFVHATYLVNLGSQKPEHLEKSINWLIWAITFADKLGVTGVIVHTGSHKGKGFEIIEEQVVTALKRILDETSACSTKLILETSAGGGGTIGRNFHELGLLLKKVNNDRLKVCMDTQHIFAAGYDYRTQLVLKDMVEEFESEIGFANLAAIHANDSKTEYKSQRDRHENIGDGFVGREGFGLLLNHPSFSEVPFILEVPGIAGNGPDKENVDILKSLRDGKAHVNPEQ